MVNYLIQGRTRTQFWIVIPILFILAALFVWMGWESWGDPQFKTGHHVMTWAFAIMFLLLGIYGARGLFEKDPR